MNNRIDLSTIGVQLHYCVETNPGEMPKTGYTRIYGIKSTPSLNPSPDALETTTLDELEYKTYVDGLKDLGGALEFTFNLTEDLVTKWDALVTAHKAGKAEGKKTWFCIIVPGLTDAFYFPGNPSPMGLPETTVNSVLEITNYITPVGAPVKDAKPTGV